VESQSVWEKLRSITMATFEPHVGGLFRVEIGLPEPVQIELLSVTELTGGPPRDASRRAPFSLVFRGPKEFFFRQNTYLVEHHTIGNFVLFLVPILPDENGTRYEALFT
jgi:hypothetical protein